MNGLHNILKVLLIHLYKIVNFSYGYMNSGKGGTIQ